MMIEARALAFAYDPARPVLRGVDLTLGEGEFMALAGPNGAGKSTLFALLSQNQRATSGSLALFGRPAGQWPAGELARRMAVLPQTDLAPPGLTAFEVVLLGRSPFMSGLLRFESSEDRALAEHAMEIVGVRHLAGRVATTLSGGELRLVMLARALAQQPRLLLLDEPASSLDLHHQQELFRLLARLNAEQQLTILAVTHDLNLAALFCGRLALLHEGRIAADGPPAALLNEATLRPIYRADLWTGHRPDGTPVVGLLV